MAYHSPAVNHFSPVGPPDWNCYPNAQQHLRLLLILPISQGSAAQLGGYLSPVPFLPYQYYPAGNSGKQGVTLICMACLNLLLQAKLDSGDCNIEILMQEYPWQDLESWASFPTLMWKVHKHPLFKLGSIPGCPSGHIGLCNTFVFNKWNQYSQWQNSSSWCPENHTQSCEEKQ